MYPNPNPNPNQNPNQNPNPNPNSSQPHHSTTAGSATNHQHRHQLTRYGSAPSSVFHSSEAILSAGIHSSQSNGVQKYSNSNNSVMAGYGAPETGGGRGGGGGVSSNLTMSLAGGVVTSSSNSGLIRHSSSPPDFLQRLATSDTGFTLTKGGQSYNNSQPTSSHGVHKQSRLGASQLSFTNQVNHPPNASLKRASSSSSHSTSNGFSISQWKNGSSLMFGSSSSSKRGKNVSDDLLSSFSAMDSQMEFSEMGVMDNMMHIPEDSVACKIRAKRGFATHPRSIAERERRTRISGKLKKLQELVPNMDTQTSYAEMLDLAIQHITGLQFQIQKLNKEVNNCTCRCKPQK